MNLNTMLKNWKTTSAGLASIAVGVPLTVAAIKSKSTDVNSYTPGFTAIVMGLGLIFAGDADASKKDHDALQQQVNETQKAVVSGDTTLITKQQNEKTTPPDSTVKP